MKWMGWTALGLVMAALAYGMGMQLPKPISFPGYVMIIGLVVIVVMFAALRFGTALARREREEEKDGSG
jgi:purine-cytosine permease-like protein